MNQSAPFWVSLTEGPDFWVLKGPDVGFVKVLDPATDRCVGAFAFQVCSDLRERLVQMLRPYAAEVKGTPKVKIVTDSRLSVAARAAAGELGFTIEKIVERAGDFEVRFEPKEGKLHVSALEKTNASGRPRIRVLIVDDSPLICSILTNILNEDKDLEVVASVGEPSQVIPAIERFKPDVITLDIHLPEMTGVELLRRYMPKFNVPTIIFTSISQEEGPLVLNALEAGAVDYIQKPSSKEVTKMTPMILAKVKAAAKIVPRSSTPVKLEKAQVNPSEIDPSRLIAIGSSTGGTKALLEILIRLPKEIPPILIAQHIPAGFSKAFADRLNSVCEFEVCEARQGEAVRPGKVIVAPGGRQMRLLRTATGPVVTIEDSQSEFLHKPSVDVLFQSVDQVCGPEAVALLLTGMGSDGAKGMLALRNKGCATFAQDEASCIVFGMPQAAQNLGAAGKMVPLMDIAQELMNEVSGKNKAQKKAG